MTDILILEEIIYHFLSDEQKDQFEIVKSLPNCQILDCNNNRITNLPELPNCRELYCEDNQITNLPELPNCRILNCSDNQISVLPELPYCKVLNCYKNQLTILPELPNIRELNCSNNQLTILPELPNCYSLYIDYNTTSYYSKQITDRFGLQYPSPGHRAYFKGKWNTIINKIKLMKLLMEITGLDEYISAKIIRFI